MPAETKKTASKKQTLQIHVGNMVLTVEPVPADEVARANARIQRRVQPIFNKLKRTRRAAAITASKIILNA